MVLNVQLILHGMAMLSFGHCILQRQWNYVPLAVVTTSSDETKLNMSYRIQRLGRDEYAVSGICDVKFDTDKNTMAEVTIYISESGSEDDYVPTPFKIEKQPLYKVIEKFYKETMINNFGYCSNIPKAEDAIKLPFPQGLYTFNRCRSSGEGMPNIIASGYYKVVFAASGEVDFQFIMYNKVTTKRLF